jgi:hypothetical protein
MNEIPGLGRKIQLVELPDIKAYTDRNRIGIAIEVFKIQADLVSFGILISATFFVDAIPVLFKDDPGYFLDEVANKIKFTLQPHLIDGSLHGEIEIVREARKCEVGLTEGIPTFKNQDILEFAYAVDATKQPAKYVVPLDIRVVNLELFGFGFNFILGDHWGVT